MFGSLLSAYNAYVYTLPLPVAQALFPGSGSSNTDRAFVLSFLIACQSVRIRFETTRIDIVCWAGLQSIRLCRLGLHAIAL